MKAIFEHKNHFLYLKERLDPRNSSRGIKTKFAEYLRIQPAFLSQVMIQKHSLSLEQADLANQFFDHSTEESDFFILLVCKDRAGTASLKNYYTNQINAILTNRQKIADRLGKKIDITEEVKNIYYSSWLYSAIHIGCTIFELQTRKEIAKRFNITEVVAGKVLDFLEHSNLIKKENDRYVATQNWVRLEGNSSHLIKHHTNWRNKTIQSFDQIDENDLHYSGVYSLDKNTYIKIKENILEFIRAQIKEIEPAKEEDLICFSIDLYSLVKKV